MRQNNNNKNRMRGRGRKAGNSLNRNFESNGPDVKIRGNAGHIAEKYQNLARDALSNGDTVMAENYYQHAEHYNRIVAAAQQQNNQNNQNNRQEDSQGANGRGPQPEIEGVPAEVALSENADENLDAGADTAKQSKSDDTRGRKRGRQNKEPQDGDGTTESSPEMSTGEPGNANQESKPKGRTRRPRTPRTEGISEDAAALPESLTAAPSPVEDRANLAED